MLKSSKLKFLTIISLFLSLHTFCLGQSARSLLDTYLKDYHHFSRVDFLLDQRFPEARNLPGKIDVEIRTLEDLELLISHQITTNVYGVSLLTKDSLNFDKMIGLLAKFPNLEYLQIQNTPFFSSYRKSSFQLPESVKQLNPVKLIEFYGTKNLDLPDAISKLSSLKNLIGLSFLLHPGALPQQITELNNIRLMQLSTENLEGLELEKVNWQFLKLSGSSPQINKDEAVLKKISTVKSLKDLSLTYCGLSDATVFSKFKNLRSLSINSPKFSSTSGLFAHISTLKTLQKLTVTNLSDSAEMLTGIERLKNLKSLEIRNISSLKSTPEQLEKIGQLKNLRSLEMQAQGKVMVPDFFASLTALKSLTIGGHDLSKAINSIFLLPSLDTLMLAANQLTMLPDMPEYRCSRLKILHLQYNKITVLPNAILSLKKLEILNLANNSLHKIPVDGWEQMRELKNVTFTTNKITHFPAGLQLVKNLTELDLSRNKISGFPELKGEGYQLKSLIITDNQISHLPENIGNFNKLEVFMADHNQLTHLPNSLGNCKNLKRLNLSINNIQSLPEGIKDCKSLELLNVGGNTAIDATSVFNILFSMPRKHFNVDLSKIALQTIPASEAWKTLSFERLNLNDNELRSLPPQFAETRDFGNLSLNNNPLGIEPFICNRPIRNKSDMKILYQEIGISLTNNIVSNAEYATALAKRITDFYYAKNFEKAIVYANKAISIDAPAYQKEVAWDEIGTCRLKMLDYRGAILDFDHFILKEEASSIHWGSSLDLVALYKSEAHLALGETEEAVKTHIYFAKQYGKINGLVLASVMYKELGNQNKAKELMDTVIIKYQQRVLSDIKFKNPFDPNFVVEYAEVLLIGEQPAEAIKLLNSYEEKVFTKKHLAIRAYLLATAMYLNDEKTYEQAKSDLVSKKTIYGKVTGWNFDMFNSWMKMAFKSEKKKMQLLALETAATK